MPVEGLRCRMCQTDHPAVANGVCGHCFGPLEPIYDWDAVAKLATREGSRAWVVVAVALQHGAPGRLG